MKYKKILSILILAFVLRLIQINQSLWLDESIGAWAVDRFSYNELVTEFLHADNHPPLYYLLLKLWTSIFGYSEISIRMPSILFGLGTVYLTYLIALELSDKWKDLDKKGKFSELSALILATSQFHVYYSQEARMYSMAAFFATASVYFLIKSFKNRDINNWIWFTFTVTGLLFTDYMPVFMLPVYLFSAVLIKKDKMWWKRFILSFMPLFILGLIWLPTFRIQSERGRWLLETLPAWRDLAGGASLKQAALFWMKMIFGRISFTPKIFYYSSVVLASIPYLISLMKALFSKDRKDLKVIWIWLLLPTGLSFIASFVFPAFIYFRLLFVFPALVLLTAFGISKIENKLIKKLVTIAILIFNFIGLGIYYFDKEQQREDWKGAVAFVEQNTTTKDIVLFEYPEPFTPYTWYTNKPEIAHGATNSISADLIKTKNRTQNLILNKDKIYHFDYLRDLSDPSNVVEQTIHKAGYEEAEVYNFIGVGQVSIWEK